MPIIRKFMSCEALRHLVQQCAEGVNEVVEVSACVFEVAFGAVLVTAENVVSLAISWLSSSKTLFFYEGDDDAGGVRSTRFHEVFDLFFGLGRFCKEDYDQNWHDFFC